MRVVTALSLLSVLPACAPSVRVPVLQPAAVEVPADVQTIGVIDRSGPKNVGEGILGAIEGAVTGEGVLADEEGREAATSAVVFALQESPRFDVVQPNVDRREADSGLFDKRLDQRLVRRICRKAGCDALLSLEAFDSDSFLHIGGEPIDRSQEYGEVTVSRDTRVLASWRLYDADDDQILDEVRSWTREETWDEYGESLDEALRGLPGQGYTIRYLGEFMGADYGRRIAPTWVDVTRHYYGGGHPDLKQAKRHVKVQDWDGARRLWAGLIDHPDAKVRGKAHFNLALASEVEGDLRKAVELAREAAIALNNPRSRRYVEILRQRRDDQRRLERQLAPPPPEEQGDDKPLARPGPSSDKPSRDGRSGGDDKPSSDGRSSDDDEGATMSRPR